MRRRRFTRSRGALAACSSGSSTVGACGLCNRASDPTCKATCERVCDFCAPVPEAEVAAVTCLDTTLNVRKTDNSTVLCTKK